MSTSYTDAGTLSNLNNMFKVVYPKEFIDAQTPFNILAKEIPFDTMNKTGQKYVVPVVLSLEAGATFLAYNAGIQELNSPIQAYVGSAEVTGSQVYLRQALDYATIFQSLSDKQAFARATSFTMKNLATSMQKIREQNILYGSWLATTTGTAASYTSGTSIKVTISDATWAAGVWAGSEKMQVQAYDAGTSLISSGADSIFTVDAVDFENKRVTLTGSTAGLLAFNTALAVTGGTTVELHYNGAKSSSMTGLYTILSNTSSTIFNIDASAYSSWQGNPINVGTGTLTPTKLFTANARLAGRGMMGDSMCLLSPNAWHQIVTVMSGIQRFDYSYRKDLAKFGVGALEVLTNTGKMTLYSHPLVKEGHVFLIPSDGVKRIGSTDITYGDPVTGDFVTRVPSYNCLEVLSYMNSAVFVEKPAHGGILTGFTIS